MATSWTNEESITPTSWTPEESVSTSWENENTYLGQTRQAWDGAIAWDAAEYDWTGTGFTIWENELSV